MQSEAITDRTKTRAAVQADPTQCSLGKWLHSEETAKLRAADPALDMALAAIYSISNS